MADTLPLICPTCRQPWPAKGRVCAACESPIKKHHKYTFIGGRVIHRDCQNPTGTENGEGQNDGNHRD